MSLSPEVRDYSDAISSRLRDALGDELIGVWLLGSAALGGFDVERSDIDLLVVSRQVEPIDTRLFVAGLVGPDGVTCPAQGVELVWYAVADLQPLGDPPAFQLNVNGGRAREHKVQLGPGAEADHWFVIDLASGRDSALPVLGPELASVASPVPEDRVRAALRASLTWHDDSDAGSPNRVLNAARTIRYLQTGVWTNKLDAGSWLAGEQPALAAAVTAARRARNEGRWMDPQLGATVAKAARDRLDPN